MQKTAEKILIGKRLAVIYVGSRGGKYIKKDGKFVPLRNFVKKGGDNSIDFEKNYVSCDSCNPGTLKYQVGEHYKNHEDNRIKVYGTSAFDTNRTEEYIAAECYLEKIKNKTDTECTKRVPIDFNPSQEQTNAAYNMLSALSGGRRKKRI